MEEGRSLQFVFIGGGKMGEAILAGWLNSDAVTASDLGPENFTIVEPNEARQKVFEESYGVSCVTDIHQVDTADVVILAVKPQVMFDVLSEVKDLAPFTHSLFISIAAGIPTSSLIEALPSGSRLVRVMPNLPLVVAEGASVVCASERSSVRDVETVRDLFACLGVAEIIDEKDMDAACALSGSGPAYVAAMIEALTKAGIDQGLSASLAENLALQTVYGTAAMLKETKQAPAELRKAVSSPGGTTVAALSAMEEAGMDSVYDRGIAAAVRRAKELGACKA